MCSIFFAPELIGVAKYTSEFAAWLASRGHDVRVVTAQPSYPNWTVHEGYESSRYARESWRGVDVLRCPLWVPAEPSTSKRLVHLTTFAASTFPVLLGQVSWRPEVIWVVEPPIFCAPASWLAARMCRATAWLHIQDFEIDVAFRLRMLGGRGAQIAAEACERWVMRRFDRVSTISERMMERAAAKGVDTGRLVLFRNWADRGLPASTGDVQEMRDGLGIAHDAVVVLYSGAMGRKQGLGLLAEAASRLKEDSRVVFVFCGNGPGREGLLEHCKGLPNVRFLDLQPVASLPALLGMADVHLLPQEGDAADLVMPSKLTGMLASGRPVVVTCAQGTELARVVKECGLLTAPGDAKAFADAVRELVNDEELRRRLGANGRQYADRFLRMDAVLEDYERAILGSIGIGRDAG